MFQHCTSKPPFMSSTDLPMDGAEMSMSHPLLRFCTAGCWSCIQCSEWWLPPHVMLAPPHVGAVPQALQRNDHPHKDFGVEARLSPTPVLIHCTTQRFRVSGNGAVTPRRCRRRHSLSSPLTAGALISHRCCTGSPTLTCSASAP